MANPTFTPRALRDMHETAASTLIPLFSAFGMSDPNYSPESLISMERLINELYPEGSKKPSWPLLIPFGFYFGETIVRNIPGAAWKTKGFDELDIEMIEVHVPAFVKGHPEPGKAVVRPYMRAVKFWFDRTDGFRVVFDMLNAQSLGFFDPDKFEGPEWKPLGNKGNHVRMFRGESEEEVRKVMREADKTHPFKKDGDANGRK